MLKIGQDLERLQAEFYFLCFWLTVYIPTTLCTSNKLNQLTDFVVAYHNSAMNIAYSDIQ